MEYIEHQDISRTEGFRQRPKLLYCMNGEGEFFLDVLLT